MPRAANAYSKNGPAIAPGDDEVDRRAAAQQTVRIVPAEGAPPVKTSAAPSIFAAGEAAKPKAQPRLYRTLDVTAVEIKTGVPLPPASPGVTPVYKQLWERIPAGGMVELSKRQAHGLAAHCKKVGAKYAIRTLGEDRKGVWRLE